ncbi:nucleotide-diphospho-sugar transferase [Trichophaea hybrida]|nr:nucleotide-diphospho-sugar transferase [Trichophaea hybrida]
MVEPEIGSPNLSHHHEGAWVVLLTRPSYLLGVITLGHSFKKVDSKYPFVVAITPSLLQYAVDALLDSGLQVKNIQPIAPKNRVDVVAERFEDTWTKLTVFGFEEYKQSLLMVTCLSSEIWINFSPSTFQPTGLQPTTPMSATLTALLGLQKTGWNEAHCAYTPLTHPSALTSPTLVTLASIRTHTLLNSSLVVFTPSMAVLASMLQFLYTSPLVPTFSFPDQDFLAHFFAGLWKPLGWQYNAIKMARY